MLLVDIHARGDSHLGTAIASGWVGTSLTQTQAPSRELPRHHATAAGVWSCSYIACECLRDSLRIIVNIVQLVHVIIGEKTNSVKLLTKVLLVV